MKQLKPLNFNTDFCIPNLLRTRKKFLLKYEEHNIIFSIPTFGEMQDSINNYDIVIALLNSKPEEFNMSEMGFKAENSFQLFSGILLLNKVYREIINNFFTTYIQDFHFEKNIMYVGDLEVSEDIFNILKIMFLVGTGKLPYSAWTDFIKERQSSHEKEMDDLSKDIMKKLKASEDKVKKIKSSAKTGKEVEIEIVILAIISELPSFNFDNIFDMNCFSLYWLHSNLPRLLDNKIQTIAAGNGLTKDYKYFA